MRFCICIKQVPDVSAPVHTGRLVLNAYDASAVEESLRLKEKHGITVDLVLVGPETAAETIRKALAMGADEAVHIVHDEVAGQDAYGIASILCGFFASESYDVILCGKQSQDTDAGLTGPMLAETLGLPYASNAVGLDLDGQGVRVERQGDGGLEVLSLPTPCLVTCSNDMNDPRIPSLRGIMAAKKKVIREMSAASFVPTMPVPRTVTLGLEPAPERPPGLQLEGDLPDVVRELVRRLRDEDRVLHE